MSTMSKFASASGLSVTRGNLPRAYINTSFYKTEFASFKLRLIRHRNRRYGARTIDTTYSPSPPGSFPPKSVSIPHDISLITTAFCPRILSINDIMSPVVSINRILTTPSNLHTYDIPTTMIVFGDAAVTLVKERISAKEISSKGSVVAEEATPVNNYLSAPVQEANNRSFAIYFGDAEPISVPNSSFRNFTLMAKENIIPLSHLTCPYYRVINGVTNISTSSTVVHTKIPKEQMLTTPTEATSRPQNLSESKPSAPTTANYPQKVVSLSGLAVNPRSSTTRQTRSVFEASFKKYRALSKKNVMKDFKVANAGDNKTRSTDNVLGIQIVEDIPISTRTFLETITEVEDPLPISSVTGAKSGASLQTEADIITQLSTFENSGLVAEHAGDRIDATMLLHSPSFASVESSQVSTTKSPVVTHKLERVIGVEVLPTAGGESVITSPLIQGYTIINNSATPVNTNPSGIITRPRVLASACDYARMFDASIRTKGGESVKPNSKPKHKHIIPPTTEPQHIPAVNNMQSLQTVRDVARQFDLESPGTGTLYGPRNDNDWRDIAKIQVMPTIDELLPGRRTVYMPKKEKMFPLARVVDVAFRHYRESSLGRVRDGTANAMMRMIQGVCFPSTTIETSVATYNAYPNTQVERGHCTEGRFASPAFSLAFTSPGHEYIAQDKVLRSGHLLALLTLSGVEVEVTWLKAAGSWSDRDGHGRISAIGKIDAEILDGEKAYYDVQRLLGLQESNRTSVLLDFGGALLDGFVNALTVLQQMAHEQLPFAEALFRPEVGSSIVEVPQYLRDLQVDLSPLGYNLSVHLPSDRVNAEWEKTMRDILASPNEDKISLTGGQATAIIHSLTSSLSAIQGPPGTGKSFIGSRVTKLLCTARRERSGFKTIPILMTAQTNHALDETLASYIKSGLKVARFGIAQGKEKPEPEHVAWQGYRLPQEEGHKVRRRIIEAKRGREDATQELTKLLEEFSNGLLSWFRVAPYLEENLPAFHRAFSDTVTDGRSEASGLYAFWAANKDASEATALSSVLQNTIPEGFRRRISPSLKVAPAETIESTGGDSGRSVEEMLTVDDPWTLDGIERLRLVNSWRQELNKSLLSRVKSAQAVLHTSKMEFEEASREEVVAKILGFGVDVIGCTTTRVARDRELFKMLGIEVLVVEEAGEVIEANTLTGLLPSLQQLIAIGDHKQLKPFCDHRVLAGTPYEHDQSLFERLVSPNTNGAPPIITLAQLDTQRRMRLEIADLLRALSLYPVLHDGENVKEYPDVPSMGGCHLAWVDHQVGEREVDHSFCNVYEAEMIAAHAGYLARTGEFGIRSIVIIAPYNGQIREIRAALCREPAAEIAVPEGDMELLAARNPEYRTPLLSVESVTLMSVRMEDVVRVTTVDNFQGEEADVVFYSAVRSNWLGRLGFVDVSNRVCVSLSRARHALYIYGDAKTARAGGTWWRLAAEHLERKGLITNGVIMGSCPRHPTSPIMACAPSDFKALTTARLCSQPCSSVLACGHVCGRACHADKMHGMPSLSCQSPCVQVLPCGHPCREACGKVCGSCKAPQTLTLPCGHELSGVPCHQVDQEHRCLFPCPALLSCGHGCAETCGTWACRQGSHSVCERCSRGGSARIAAKVAVIKAAEHDGKFHSFVKTYQARAVSLSQGRQGSRTNREILLDGFSLSRAGLLENGFLLATRMDIFRSFGEDFRVVMKEAGRFEKAGGVGLVKRLEAFKATVRSALEEDYHWFYNELVKRSTPNNYALRLAESLKVAVQSALE